MQRRGKTGQPQKGRRKRTSLKARKAPTTRGSTDHFPEQFDRLKRERAEALEQLGATSEVLKVIASSPGNLQPVFAAMLESATRICDASYGAMWLCEEDAFRNAAFHGALPAVWTEQWPSGMVIRLDSDLPLARAARSQKPLQVADMREDRAYRKGHPLSVQAVDIGGIRTLLCVPMLKDNKVVGALVIYRKEVRPFTNKQIKLVQNFAAQAVIAIENTRLLNELRESLQQQTATADVLKVISRSAFDLKTVLDALMQAAARLCEADQGAIAGEQDGVYQRVATFGYSNDFKEYVRALPVIPGRGTAAGRALLEGKVVHIPDVLADSEYTFAEGQKLGGFRTILDVPMFREARPIGVLSLARPEVRPFTDKQIELVTTFADQAAIAIENTRLLNELRESL